MNYESHQRTTSTIVAHCVANKTREALVEHPLSTKKKKLKQSINKIKINIKIILKMIQLIQTQVTQREIKQC